MNWIGKLLHCHAVSNVLTMFVVVEEAEDSQCTVVGEWVSCVMNIELLTINIYKSL